MYDVVKETTGLIPDPSLHKYTGACSLQAGHGGQCVVLAARWMFARVSRNMRWSAACAATVAGVPAEVSLAFVEGHPGVDMVLCIEQGMNAPERTVVVRLTSRAALELISGLALWPRDAIERMAQVEVGSAAGK